VCQEISEFIRGRGFPRRTSGSAYLRVEVRRMFGNPSGSKHQVFIGRADRRSILYKNHRGWIAYLLISDGWFR
jgi:hypothetical protein